MSSTFGGLNTARTALWASQRGLDVTGQNIANVNTDGYSRQRVELRAMGGTAVPAIHSVSSPVGNGVDASQVDRIRDVFLERRGQVETARTAQLTAADEALAQVEAAFREPGPTGIRSMLDDVWAGFNALANAQDPTEPAVRSQVLERLGVGVNPSLRKLADAAPAPWNDLYAKHHETLLVLVTELRGLADTNRELIEGGLSAIGDALLAVKAPSAGTYGSTGRSDERAHRAVTLDGAL